MTLQLSAVDMTKVVVSCILPTRGQYRVVQKVIPQF